MADNIRTSIELVTEITNNLNRSVSAINGTQLLNDAIYDLSIKFPFSFLRGTDKASVTSNSYVVTVSGFWTSIDNVFLILSNSELPLKPMTQEHLSLYFSGFNTDATITTDTLVTTTGQPYEYFIMPLDVSRYGITDTRIQWEIFLYPLADQAYTLRFEGQRYYPYLPSTVYNTGTISSAGVTATITGAGTTWTTTYDTTLAFPVGHYLWVGSETTGTRIQSVTNDTTLVLSSTHAAIAGGTSYAIKRQENYLTLTHPNLIVAYATALGFDILGEGNEADRWMNKASIYFNDIKKINIMANKQRYRAFGYKTGSKIQGHGF